MCLTWMPLLRSLCCVQSCTSEVLALLRSLCNDGSAERTLSVVRRLLSSQRSVVGILNGFVSCGGGADQLALVQAMTGETDSTRVRGSGTTDSARMLNCMSMIMSGCGRYPDQTQYVVVVTAALALVVSDLHSGW